LDERDVTRAWQNLFNGKAVTPDALVKAEELLDGLSGESPLHLRFANELAELKKMGAVSKVVRPKLKKVK
jgi:hypothetical protein